MSRFYLVSAVPRPGVSYEQIEEALDGAWDWYRFGLGQWVIYDDADADWWYEVLQPKVKRAGQLFVCALDISDHAGWMSDDFWKWLSKRRRG